MTTTELLKEENQELRLELERMKLEIRRLRAKLDEALMGEDIRVEKRITDSERLIKAKPVSEKKN